MAFDSILGYFICPFFVLLGNLPKQSATHIHLCMALRSKSSGQQIWDFINSLCVLYLHDDKSRNFCFVIKALINMTFIKISMCHLKEVKCGLVSIWKCFRLCYRGHLSSSGFHLPNCQPYLIYGDSFLFFMTLTLLLPQVRPFFGKPILKQDRLMLYS